MAAEGVAHDEIVAATHICRNKSSLATILANPIYRGIKVFNRETRVEGEHGRRRRRNGADEVVTSEVDAIVPDQLWNRVQELLARRREHRLAPQRYAGGYVLTDILRCGGHRPRPSGTASASTSPAGRCTAPAWWASSGPSTAWGARARARRTCTPARTATCLPALSQQEGTSR